MQTVDILIVGAGPTGLGASSHLHSCSWLLLDKQPHAGGLASTDVTQQGFLFDIGGHVIFSHYTHFDRLLETSVGSYDSAWELHVREAYVRYAKNWVPYPFQNNLCKLPVADQVRAIEGLIDVAVQAAANPGRRPKTFDEWIVSTMGVGLADMFMRPYNFKTWGFHPDKMTCGWLGDRVAVVDVKKAVKNVLANKTDEGWGPNAVFRFPKQGGTGHIWEKVAERLPQDNVVYNCTLEKVDVENKLATVLVRDLETNSTITKTISYSYMISTIPLDVLLTKCDMPADARIKHSSTHVIGVGVRGQNPHGTKCWMYFPEDNTPFYRATVFSNYSPGNVPGSDVSLPTWSKAKDWTKATMCPTLDGKSAAATGPYWSLMFEVCESSEKPVDFDSVVSDCIRGAMECDLVSPEDEIVSIHHRRMEHGYPTPSLGRDEALLNIQPRLAGMGIFSRGRFGAYKYEVSNQDHSVAQGRECIDFILKGIPEITLSYPNIVNRGPAQFSHDETTKREVSLLRLPSQNEFSICGEVFKTNVHKLKRKLFISLEEYVEYLNL